MAVKLDNNVVWKDFKPGESRSGYSRGSVVGFSAGDAVLIQAIPSDRGAAYETTVNFRGFADDDGTPIIDYTVKNVGNATDSLCRVLHVIVSG